MVPTILHLSSPIPFYISLSLSFFLPPSSSVPSLFISPPLPSLFFLRRIPQFVTTASTRFRRPVLPRYTASKNIPLLVNRRAAVVAIRPISSLQLGVPYYNVGHLEYDLTRQVRYGWSTVKITSTRHNAIADIMFLGRPCSAQAPMELPGAYSRRPQKYSRRLHPLRSKTRRRLYTYIVYRVSISPSPPCIKFLFHIVLLLEHE